MCLATKTIAWIWSAEKVSKFTQKKIKFGHLVFGITCIQDVKKITEHLESFFIVPYIFIQQVKKLTWIFSKTRKHKYFKIFLLVRKMLQYPHALNLLLCCVKFLLLRKLHNKISDFFANIMETNIDILLGFPHLLEIFTLLPLQLTLLSFVFVKDSCGVFPSLCNDWFIESFLLVMYFCQGKQGIAS